MKLNTKSLLLRTFFKIISAIFVILVAINIYLYLESVKKINEEFINANYTNVQKTARLTDGLLEGVKTITSYLSLDETVRFYLLSRNPDEIIPDFKKRIKDKVSIFPMTYKYIDSVYIYSETMDFVYSGKENQPTAKFADLNWMEQYEKAGDDIAIFARTITDSYPYVISFMKKIEQEECKGAVIANVNLRNLGDIIDGANSTWQKNYILNEDSIIYQKDDYIFGNIKDNKILSTLSERGEYTSLGRINNEYYAFGRVKSDLFQWEYVSLTHINNYRNVVSGNIGNRLLWMVAYIIAGIITAYILSSFTYKPIKWIINLLKQPNVVKQYSNEQESEEIKYIAQEIIATINKSERLKAELESHMDILNKTHVYALQSQINPHFLYNTLNIISLSLSQKMGIYHSGVELILSLSELIRYSLDVENTLVTVETELKYAKLYINILKQRHGEDLAVVWQVNQSLNKAKIPKLCLQPIIENAVYHGLNEMEEEKGVILIKAVAADECLLFEIHDNGIGIEQQMLDRLETEFENFQEITSGHIGLKNVHQRIKLMFGGEYGIRIESDSAKNKGTTVFIKLPLI